MAGFKAIMLSEKLNNASIISMGIDEASVVSRSSSAHTCKNVFAFVVTKTISSDSRCLLHLPGQVYRTRGRFSFVVLTSCVLLYFRCAVQACN